MNNHKNKVLGFFVILYIFVLVVLQAYLIINIGLEDKITPIASNVYGEVKFCINHPPFMNNTCNLTARQNQAYSCKFNASDPENINLTFFSNFITSPTVFQISPEGWVNYTPNSSHSGSHTVYIGVYDDSACANNEYADIFSFDVSNINDPPILITPIPNQTWTYGTTITPFDLDTFFYDPDNDVITYTTAPESLTDINVSIDSNNRVSFRALDDFSGTATIIFFAWDPYYANGSSNEVKLTVMPRQNQSNTSSVKKTVSSGGGGGGARGAGYSSSCLPKWYCRPWGVCEPDSLRKRECYDLNNCSTNFGKPNTTEACTFISTCFDGFMGPEEEYIDCGGPCPPCGNCYDNLCNNKEDCTKSLSSKPDCGGNCKPCAVEKKETCFDNLCNNGEDCVYEKTVTPDCGGTCMPCVITEMPKRILSLDPLILLLILLGGLLSMHLAKKISLYLNDISMKKKAKTPMLDAESTKALYENILELEKLLETGNIEKVILMFSEIIRKYFKSLLKLKYECTFDEIFEEISALGLSESFINVLVNFFERSTEVEFSGKSISKIEINAMIEEFKQIVSLTSTIRFEEEPKQKKKITPNKAADEIFFMISSAEADLRNKRLNQAYQKYLNINKEFKNLEKKDKEKIHGFISRLYEEIKLTRELYVQTSK